MTKTRDRERTKQAILTATAQLLRQRGVAVSLEAIAAEVGVSKGALLHHFPNRKVLIRAVTEHAMEVFHSRVMANLDLSENHPGKLLRAYIRTLFSEDSEQTQFDHLLDVLATIGEIKDLLVANARTWDEGFAADGLDPDRLMLVSNAAEGFIAATHWDPTIATEQRNHMRDLLLEITNENGPLTRNNSKT